MKRYLNLAGALFISVGVINLTFTSGMATLALFSSVELKLEAGFLSAIAWAAIGIGLLQIAKIK